MKKILTILLVLLLITNHVSVFSQTTKSSGTEKNSEQYYYSEDNANADIVVRIGDVDNFGFGWNDGFDPFCGFNTNAHPYPWETKSNDYLGTDRIMVVSSYKTGYSDGYAAGTSRPNNSPINIKIEYKKPTIQLNKIVLQLMLDDFQSSVWGTSYQFKINDKRLLYIENIINLLNQTGPTGKLVQVGILPEDNYLFESGNITINIDDPITGAGDGFAIDFIQILINPKGEYKCIGNINGVVKDEQGNFIEDVLISANGLKETLSNKKGVFTLQGVPIGLISVVASKSKYSPSMVNLELNRDETKNIELILKRNILESENYLNEEISKKGFVNIYGIHFDSGKDIPKQKSTAALKELAKYIKNNPNLNIEIIGHTDSDGDSNLNQDLSLRRAQSIIKWLQKNGVNISNIKPTGLGESSPIASNKTNSGKALNRRVEIRVLKK